jgi:hypothetical protein
MVSAYHGSGAVRVTVDFATAVLLTVRQCLTNFFADGTCIVAARQQTISAIAPLQAQRSIQVALSPTKSSAGAPRSGNWTGARSGISIAIPQLIDPPLGGPFTTVRLFYACKFCCCSAQ